jgi:Mlc titration factor MtfA (ptsG expression regulator)
MRPERVPPPDILRAPVVFSWLFPARKRERILGAPFPAAHEAALSRLRFFAALPEDDRATLRRHARLLLAEKRWEGCAGFDLTDERRVAIAGTAARLSLRLGDDAFRRLRTVLVYPATYDAGPQQGPDGLHHESSPRGGEAWDHGTVVLSWDGVESGLAFENDGRNVVLHEFAHVLDWADGWADGTPPLRDRAAHAAWAQVLRREFAALVEASRNGRRTVLDEYGATDPAEFFAVATEAFFERPAVLRDRHPALYERLRDFYRQDPAPPRPSVP